MEGIQDSINAPGCCVCLGKKRLTGRMAGHAADNPAGTVPISKLPPWLATRRTTQQAQSLHLSSHLGWPRSGQPSRHSPYIKAPTLAGHAADNPAGTVPTSKLPPWLATQRTTQQAQSLYLSSHLVHQPAGLHQALRPLLHSLLQQGDGVLGLGEQHVGAPLALNRPVVQLQGRGRGAVTSCAAATHCVRVCARARVCVCVCG